MASKTLLTAEEFDRLEAPEGFTYELDEGLLVTIPAPFPRHGHVVGQVLFALAIYLHQHPIGEGFFGVGCALRPNTIRAPDVCVVLHNVDLDAYIPGSPELVVEVISPSDSVTDLRRKLRQYFAAGAKLAWIFYPDTKEIEVWRDGRLVQTLTETDTLDGGDLLPGFSIPVAQLF